MKILQVILAVMVIFGAGVITGGLTVRLANGRKKPPQSMAAPRRWWSQQRAAFLARMRRQLDLTPDQRQKIDQILQNGQERMQALWLTIAPRARQEARRTRQAIIRELTPEQRRKFERLFKLGAPHTPGELRPPRLEHKNSRSNSLVHTNQPPAQTNL